MGRLRTILRAHWPELAVAAMAAEAALEVVVRDDALRAPRSPAWLAAPAVALVVLTLLVRRRHPFGAPVALWVAAAAVSVLDGRLMVFTAGAYAAGLAAAFALGALDDPLRARTGLVVVVAGSALVALGDPEHSAGDVAAVPALFAVAWLGGLALRARAAQARAADERAAHAERERESAARVAVAEERARIARELHDVVAHAVSVMVLQTGAVRHTLPPAAAEAREVLRGVETTGRDALTEMRRLLGALREDDAGALAPEPGLDDLPALAERVGRAGLPVRLHVEGERRALPRALDLSAYRIIQEGLTNALRHARASRADVTVRYDAGGVRLLVRDDGCGPVAGDGRGHGLVGMGERVKVFGGELVAGAAPGGGFMLDAKLPRDRVDA